MLKLDLGITATIKDSYFRNLITAQNSELAKSGVTLDLDKTEDIIFLSDYVAFQYRKRESGGEMPKNLQLRLMNRKIRGRAASG